MTTLADVAEMLRSARKEAGLSQDELARRAGVSRTTVARMETVAKGDMSVSALLRLMERRRLRSQTRPPRSCPHAGGHSGRAASG